MRFYKLPFTSNLSVYMLLPIPASRFVVVVSFIFFACRTTSTAQQLVDTVYLDENFTEVSDRLTAAYVQYTLFNTPAREDGLIKTFYITSEKYSEYPVYNQTLKATDYRGYAYLGAW